MKKKIYLNLNLIKTLDSTIHLQDIEARGTLKSYHRKAISRSESVEVSPPIKEIVVKKLNNNK